MNGENQRSFIILILIVIAIICIVSVGYLVLSKDDSVNVNLVLSKDEPDKFNGHWKVYLQERNNSVGFWSFYKNGSMKMISTSISSDYGNLPFIEFEDLAPESAGIRPKLQGPGEGFRDFVITHEEKAGFPGLINLIGIESPGLTAAPAIARHVSNMVAEFFN